MRTPKIPISKNLTRPLTIILSLIAVEILILCPFASLGHASMGGTYPLETAYPRASTVFSGTLLRLGQPVKRDTANSPEKGVFRRLGMDQVEHVFSTDFVWKGDPADSISVYSSLSGNSWGYRFEVGKRYLVFAYEHDGRTTTNPSYRTKPYGLAQEDLEALKSLPQGTRQEVNRAYTLNWIKDLKSADEKQRTHALRMLGMAMEEADLAVPALVKAMASPVPGDRERAIPGLARFNWTGDLARHVVIHALEDTSPGVRLAAVSWLDWATQDEAHLASLWARAAFDESPVVRQRAVQSLGKLEQVPDVTTPPLIRALADSSEKVRVEAISALGKAGLEPSEFESLLMGCQEDVSGEVRSRSLKWLVSMSESDSLAFQLAKESMADTSAKVRQQALGIIRERRFETFEEVEPIIFQSLRDSSPKVRQSALRALKRPRTNAEALVDLPKLLEAYTRAALDSDDSVSKSAMMALRGTRDPRMLPFLIEIVAEDSRYTLSEILRWYGEEILPMLESISDHENPKVRTLAQHAIDVMRMKLEEEKKYN